MQLKLIVKLGEPASGTVRSLGFPLLSLLCMCTENLANNKLPLTFDLELNVGFSWGMRVEILIPVRYSQGSPFPGAAIPSIRYPRMTNNNNHPSPKNYSIDPYSS